MQLRGPEGAAREDEGPERRQRIPESITPRLESVDGRLLDAESGRLAGSFERIAQVSPEVEQFVLDRPQYLGHLSGQLAGGQSGTDDRVCLVHITVGGYPRIGLGGHRHVAEVGFAAVAGPCVNAGQPNHADYLTHAGASIPDGVKGP